MGNLCIVIAYLSNVFFHLKKLTMKTLFKLQKMLLIIAVFCTCSSAWGQSLSNTLNSSNTLNGVNAGNSLNSSSYDNTFIGKNSGYKTTHGFRNTFIGKDAGYSNKGGDYNVFMGYNSGEDNTSGNYNTFVGTGAGESNTIGQNNVFLGRNAGRLHIDGGDNVFLGKAAGYNNLYGNRNVFIGYNAGYNETGSDKLYIENSTTQSNPLIYGSFSSDKVGINTSDVPDGYTLAVDGKVIVEELNVKLSQYWNWPDYVFEEEYDLKPIEEEQTYILKNGHLSGFESAEVMAGGISVGDITTRQQIKIEEQMLYIIQLNDLLKQQQEQISILNSKLEELGK